MSNPRGSRWGPPTPLVPIWRSPPDVVARSREQDVAAGNAAARIIQLGLGRHATASVALKHFPKSRRVYAYLRFWAEGRTVALYIGDVTGSSRSEALRHAWRIVQEKELITRWREDSL